MANGTLPPTRRLPFGSSLVACIHRLARLQTTREMHPRPTLVDKGEKAVDRLILAARRVLTLGVVAALILTSAACATPGTVKTDVWHTLTPDQQSEAQVIEGVLAKLAAECKTRRPESECVPAKVLVTMSGTTPQYQRNGHTILVPARTLNPAYRAVMAHEITHSWVPEARDDCRGEAKAFACEQAANFYGAIVLKEGYGYSEPVAIRAMWDMLVLFVVNNAPPSHGHPDSCAELHAFERMVKASELYPCQEKAR